MVDLKTLTENLEQKLNTLGAEYELNFALVADTGKYQPPIREDNTVTEYINGVFSLVTSDISNLTDGTVIATQQARVDIILRLPDYTADEVYNNIAFEGVETRISQVREILNNLTQTSELSEITDINGVKYNLSTIYQSAVTGERRFVPNIGDSFTYTLFIYYIQIEQGVNSRDMLLNLDGYILPFEAGTINRSKTFDANVFSDTADGTIENIPIQANFNISFEFPLTQNNFFETLLDNLLGNDKLNTAHCLRFYDKKSGREKLFVVSLAENGLNFETIKNVGAKVTFLPMRKDYLLLSFPDNYINYEPAGRDYLRVELATAGFYCVVSLVNGDYTLAMNYTEAGVENVINNFYGTIYAVITTSEIKATTTNGNASNLTQI